MSFYVDDLMPNIRRIVARFLEKEFRQDMTFERLIQSVKDEGDSTRVRIESLRPTGTTVPGILKTTGRLTATLRTLPFIEPGGSVHHQYHVSQNMNAHAEPCLLYTSPSPRDQRGSRMPSSA